MRKEHQPKQYSKHKIKLCIIKSYPLRSRMLTSLQLTSLQLNITTSIKLELKTLSTVKGKKNK